MKSRFILILIFLPLCVFSEIKTQSISPINMNSAIQIQDSIDFFNLSKNVEKIQNAQEQYERTISHIDRQISLSSWILGIFAFLFTIAFFVISIILGFYINYQLGKIIELKNEVEKAKNTVEKINRDINLNMKNIYSKIKREEILDILSKLKEKPENIDNFASTLYTFPLHLEDYDKVKNIYLELYNNQDEKNNVDKERMTTYKIVLFHHFFIKSLLDENIKSHISASFSEIIDFCYRKDIEKAFCEIVLYLYDTDFCNNVPEAMDFLLAISQSKFIDRINFCNLFYQIDISDRDRTKLIDILDDNIELKEKLKAKYTNK